MSQHHDQQPAPLDPEPAPPDEGRPIQFGLRSLLLLIGLSAVILSVARTLGEGYGFAAFAIGFCIYLAFVMLLIGTPRRGPVVVYRAESSTEAILYRDYLRGQGLKAVVIDGQLPGFSGLRTDVPVVMVPAAQAERALKLLREGWPSGPR